MVTVATILVVDDEPRIVQLVRDYLEHGGFTVLVASDGQAALRTARTGRPDLVVLDLGLPGLDGLDVARALRRDGEVPIIMLTARTEETDKLVGLELGADDYMTKPFSHRELLARIRAVSRRAAAAQTPDQGSVQVGELHIDFGRREVGVGARLVELTPKEYEILHCLALNTGRVVPHERLLAFVWGSLSLESDVDQLKVHIRHLREKLERNPSAPEYLITLRGVGYKLTEP